MDWPPPNVPELLVMKFTLLPWSTLQLRQLWIVNAFTPWNAEGELKGLGFS